MYLFEIFRWFISNLRDQLRTRFFLRKSNRVKIRVNFAAHIVNFRNVTRSLKYPSHGPVPLIQISSLKYSSCTRGLTFVCSGSERRRNGGERGESKAISSNGFRVSLMAAVRTARCSQHIAFQNN